MTIGIEVLDVRSRVAGHADMPSGSPVAAA
jgi:hypothetical protein